MKTYLPLGLEIVGCLICVACIVAAHIAFSGAFNPAKNRSTTAFEVTKVLYVPVNAL